ncbi:MAG: preprotein translocase subunit SecE [Alphaproteobacteria bacterium]|nr:preprotein translocase subunit SecE [Alphaproteobacteria bacterium]
MAADPVKFLREVRQETAKVTWSSRKQTIQQTIFVLVMVVIASLFFFVVDQAFSAAVRAILGFGG